jgi:hypothetical protein
VADLAPVATVADLFVVAPVAFSVGFVVGLAAASRWRIVRRDRR